MDEWKNSCDDCGEKGKPMFARIFYKKIENKWKWFCPKCWGKNSN